jgi:hypothetical protein
MQYLPLTSHVGDTEVYYFDRSARSICCSKSFWLRFTMSYSGKLVLIYYILGVQRSSFKPKPGQLLQFLGRRNSRLSVHTLKRKQT